MRRQPPPRSWCGLNHLQPQRPVISLEYRSVKKLRLQKLEWHTIVFRYLWIRVFLVSIKPDIILLIPFSYRMQEGFGGSSPYWSEGGVNSQLSCKMNYEGSRDFLMVVLGSKVQSLQITLNLLAYFRMFGGTIAVSEKWRGASTLAQMEEHIEVPFKIAPVGGMPGFLRLVLKN